MPLNFFGMIPLKWKLAAIVAVAFIFGLLRIRSNIIANAEDRIRAQIEASRAKAVEDAKEHRDEVEALDSETLAARARRWVRNPDKRG